MMKDFALATFGFAGLVGTIALLILSANVYQARRDCAFKASLRQSYQVSLTGGCLLGKISPNPIQN